MNDQSRAADKQALNAQLTHLETHQQQLIETLGVCFNNIIISRFTSFIRAQMRDKVI
jgi:hypothetical protein